MKFYIGLLLGSCLFFGQSFGGSERVGEFASYELVKGARTSSIVKAGSATIEIVDFITAEPEGEYHIQLDYQVNILLVGKKSGDKLEILPERFFTKDFFTELREKKDIDTGRVKIRHLGYVDAVTKAGVSYPNCDRIMFYDYKKNEKPEAMELDELLNLSDQDFAIITPYLNQFPYLDRGVNIDSKVNKRNKKRETTVYANIFFGAPVMGAVQIDVLHKRSGLSFVLGFDILPN